MFSEMFGSCFGWTKEQEGQLEDLRKPLIAAGKEPVWPRICKAFSSFWISAIAFWYIVELAPPGPVRNALIYPESSFFFNRSKKTPESIIYMLKNYPPSADIAEAFTKVASNIINDSDLLSNKCWGLAHTLADNCFTRDLLEKYKSIDNWGDAAAGVPPPAPQEMSSEVEASLPADGEWRQPLADWIKLFTNIVHSRIFPDEPYDEIEAKVNFLLYSFIHDVMEAQLQVFGRFCFRIEQVILGLT